MIILFYNVKKVSMPIIYIVLAIILSSICYGLYYRNKLLAIFLAIFFILCIVIKTNYYFAIIVSIFFVIQYLNCINYYNFNCDKFEDVVRIEKIESYYVIGNYKGKKVNLNNIKENVLVGNRYHIEGNFEKKIDIEEGIIGDINIEECSKIEDDLITKLYKIKRDIYYKLQDNIGKRKASLICSLAFGYKENLDFEDEKEMRNLGIIHAISVSGLHVALVYTIMKKLFRYKVALIIVTLYVLLTGADFSALRSLFMIYLLVFSKVVKRNYKSLISLLISAAILVIIKPYAIFNLGFILSYSSTLGIILYSNNIKKKFYFIPEFISDTIAISLSAQIFTVPILIYSFNYLSLSFLIGNLIIVPLLNALIILGNTLIILVNLESIFDLVSYSILKLINILDFIMDTFYEIGSKIYIVNKYMSVVYCIIIISFFFIKRGYRKFWALPIIAMIMMAIYIYSPIPKITYINKGVILLSYQGERAIIADKSNLDVSIIKKANLAQNVYREEEKIHFTNNMIIYKKNDTYVLKIKNIEYNLFNIVNKDNEVIYIYHSKVTN